MVNLVGQVIGLVVNFGFVSNFFVFIIFVGLVINSSFLSDIVQLDFNIVGSFEGMVLQVKDCKLLMIVQVGNFGGFIVVMVFGCVFVWGNYGDGMMGIFLNEQEFGIELMIWLINDIFSGVEMQVFFYL